MAITRVSGQVAKNNSGASAVSTLTVTLPSAPTAGNVVVLAGGCGQAFSIPVSGGIDWVVVQAPSAARNGFLAIGRVYAGASAAITVNAGTSSSMTLIVAEYDFSGAPAVDRTAFATATGTSPASGAAGTTSDANQLWVAALISNASGGTTFSSPSGGFAIVDQDKSSVGGTTDKSVVLLEQIVTATGTPSAGATTAASGIWNAIVASISDVVAGGGSPVTRAYGAVS